MCSLPGSPASETIWPGWTLAPLRTTSSARRSIRLSCTRPILGGAELARALDRRADAGRPWLAVPRQQRAGPRVGERLQRSEREAAVDVRGAGHDLRRAPARVWVVGDERVTGDDDVALGEVQRGV